MTEKHLQFLEFEKRELGLVRKARGLLRRGRLSNRMAARIKSAAMRAGFFEDWSPDHEDKKKAPKVRVLSAVEVPSVQKGRVAYPEQVQQAVREAGKLIREKRAASNELGKYRDNPEKLKKLAEFITETRQEIDRLYAMRDFWEKNGYLPDGLREKSELLPDEKKDLERLRDNARANISKYKKKIRTARNTGSRLHLLPKWEKKLVSLKRELSEIMDKLNVSFED